MEYNKVIIVIRGYSGVGKKYKLISYYMLQFQVSKLNKTFK